MKKLFIIGNGFDIAHNLPTKYSDYREFLRKTDNNIDFLMKLEKTYELMGDIDVWWRDFETNLGKGYNFEVEFESMAYQTIDEMVTDDGEVMYDIEDTLKKYFEQYYEFMNKLNDTVLEWVNSIDISKTKRITSRIENSESYYFTFNYTDLLEKLYGICPARVCHIHGSKYDKSVIMGHGNTAAIDQFREQALEAENRFAKNEATIANGIYEFYCASFKDTKKIINEHTLVFKEYCGIKEVHVFGHSFGMVDIPYFKAIKKHIMKDADWYFYIYCKPEEFCLKKKEWKDMLKCLHINEKHIHILSTDKF